MNIYFVSAGEVTTYGPGYYDPPETEFLVELVAAPTRRAATYEMWKKHQRDIGDLTEQRWQTKLIATGAYRNRGVLDGNDRLWHLDNLPEPGTLRV